MAAGEISAIIPSGSTDGRPIKVTATATAGTLLHTCHATHLDEVWIEAVNTDTTDRELTIETGGVTSPDDHIAMLIPARGGLVMVLPGQRFTGGVAIRAFAQSANKINCLVRVNRITTS